MEKKVIGDNVFLFFKNKELIQNENSLDKRHLLYIRNEYLKQYSNCFIYFENEQENKKEIIENKINYHERINQQIVNARKCEIKSVTREEKSYFLNKYHIQGNDRSNITYGAYYNNELVSIMSLDSNRAMVNQAINYGEYELTRFANKSGFIIKGVFNKILNFVIKELKIKKIITFADKRWTSNNNIYSKNGFRCIGTISLSYFYYNPVNNNLYHKFNYEKNKIRKKFPKIYNINKTELEMMLEIGFDRVWDCGKYKYELLLEDEKPVFGFIYKIENKFNKKIYIGQTTRNLSIRKAEYKKAILYNKMNNEYLLNSFKKYGYDNFDFSIIDFGYDIDDLNNKEIEYIKKYNTTDRNIGYNILLGGRNSTPTNETLQKMSESHKGIKQTEEWIRKRIPQAGSKEAKKFGKAKTEEEKKWLSENSPKFWKGKKRSEETKRKISETKRNTPLSNKFKKTFCKKVVSYNSYTLEIIKIYESTVQCGKNEPISEATVSRRCNGVTKNKGEIFYMFLDDFKIKYPNIL